MPFCSNCGNELPAGSKFCGACGAPVASEANHQNSAQQYQPSNHNDAPNYPDNQEYRQQPQPSYRQEPPAQPSYQQPSQHTYHQQVHTGYQQQPQQSYQQQAHNGYQQPSQQPYQQQAHTGYHQPMQNGYQQQYHQENNVTFIEAVKSAFMEHYCDFNGRVSRAGFWWPMLAYFIVMVVLIVIAIVFTAWGASSYEKSLIAVGTVFYVIYMLVSLAALLPTLGLDVRRLHDTGRSGWWVLLSFVPFGAFVLLYWFILEGDPYPNEYGDVPN